MAKSPRSLRFAVGTALAVAPISLGCTSKDDKHVNPGPQTEKPSVKEQPPLEPPTINEGPQKEPTPEPMPEPMVNPGPAPEPEPEPKRVNTGPEKTVEP